MAKTDALQEFASVKEALEQERTQLKERIAEIEKALGIAGFSYSSARSSGRRGNPSSLKSMVLEVTKDRPLTKDEILDAVVKAGYKFASKDPRNSLGTMLYTNPEIKNYGGKFGPA